ncbi:MAG: hypothetical protein WCK11_00805 [Candidatus Falkowbacteria bacterium]
MLTTFLFQQFLVPLGLTIGIEGGIAWLFLPRTKDVFIRLALVNIITNPILNIFVTLNLNYYWLPNSYTTYNLLELIVVLSETWLFVRWLKLKKAFAFWLSLCLNSASYLFGLLLYGVLML